MEESVVDAVLAVVLLVSDERSEAVTPQDLGGEVRSAHLQREQQLSTQLGQIHKLSTCMRAEE